jgi:hypothetical protein
MPRGIIKITVGIIGTASIITNLSCSPHATKAGSLPIRIYIENPWYWEYKGGPYH